METLKNSFVIHPMKSNRLSKTLSRFSTLDPKITQQLVQRKQMIMAIKNGESNSRNPSMDSSRSNDSNQQIQRKQIKRQRSQSNQVRKRQILKSVQNEKNRRNSSIDAKSLPKPRASFCVNILKKQNLFQQPNKLSLQQREPSQKTPLRIIELLKGSKGKENTNKKRILSQDSKNQNFENLKNEKIRNSHFIKYDQFQNGQKFPYLKIKKEICLSTSNQDQNGSYQAQDTLKKNQLFKLEKMAIFSGYAQVSIHPKPLVKKIQKVDQEVQVFQAEPQFFEYLTYKRKKDQFEAELQKYFKELATLMDDRKDYEERVAKIDCIYVEPPSNEREKRIFELKKEMELYQSKIMTELYKKDKQSSTISAKLSQVQTVLTTGLKKIESMSKTYLKQFRDVFQKHGEQKHARATQRIESVYTTLIKEIHSNIRKEIEANLSEKQEAKQLKYCLTELTKCMKEEKMLLKNCFDQIKYLPELFYKLFGDEISQLQPKDHQAKSGFAPKQKELPKCLRCYNSEHKMSLIIQKNILMQSILKVVDQMVN